MIRRDAGGDWLLIPQIDHARLAGGIAAAWGVHAAWEGERREEFLAAVHGHDDGWNDQDANPLFDDEHRRPRDFTEMPMAVSTSIWERSISAAAESGPFAALCVSRHFCDLAERARPNRPTIEEQEAIDHFLKRQKLVQSERRKRLGGGAGGHAQQQEEAGFRWLQFFDRMSLWICCAERDSSWRIETPDGRTLEFLPAPHHRFEIRPSPFAVEEAVRLTVTARRLPAAAYESPEALQTAFHQSPVETLQWTLHGVD